MMPARQNGLIERLKVSDPIITKTLSAAQLVVVIVIVVVA
jgi:hypothetical protein